jgi:hypothetical protein
MQKLKNLMAEYGGVAIGVYFSTFVVAMVIFSSAIAFGAEVESGTGAATTLGAAWLATKATQPVRIIATIALTPLVAKLLGKTRKPAEGAPVDPAAPVDPSAPVK